MEEDEPPEVIRKIAPKVVCLCLAMLGQSILHTTASAAQFDTGIEVIHADTAASVTLPDGSQLYTFADASQFYGVNMVGGFSHSELATEAPGSAVFHVLPGHYGHKDANGHQWQQVPNWLDETFFWPTGIFLDGTTVWIPGVRVDSSGGIHDAEIAKFNASTYAYEGIAELPGTDVWGGSVALPHGHYLMGTHDNHNGCSYVTYCKVGDLAWIPSGDEAKPGSWHITNGVIPASLNAGTGISPVASPSGGYLAYTKECDLCSSGSLIQELKAVSMLGPWTATGRTWAVSAPPGATTYGVTLHPGDSPPGQIRVSYCVNDYANGGQYDPNFFDITP